MSIQDLHDNAILERMIQELDSARQQWEAAGQAWIAAQERPAGTNGSETLEAAAALESAIEGYHATAGQLARFVRECWRKGCRLHGRDCAQPTDHKPAVFYYD